MRRLKRTFLVAGLSAVGAMALAGPAAAQNNPVKIDFTGSSKKGTLFIGLGPQAANPPFKTNNALVKISEGVTVDTGFVPDCQPSQLEGLEPTAAQAACGPPAGKSKNALIASGTAKAVVGSGAGAVTLDATSLAFAGPGSDVLVYARVDAINVTQIITCSLGNARQFKNTFNCPVPPLAGGAGALSEFNLLFDRSEVIKKKKKGSKKKKKKTQSVVKGSCPAGGAYVSEVTFTYDDAPTETNQYSDPC